MSHVTLEDGWCQLTSLVPDFPQEVPLFKSPQFKVGTTMLDPRAMLEAQMAISKEHAAIKNYRIKAVNVWFCPAKTNCRIHDHHADPEFLEVHTQIYGTGRMQKFHEKEYQSLYEDVIMSPGFTHVPFTGLREDGQFFYGWHQYYADTDCIWMAIEYHPA